MRPRPRLTVLLQCVIVAHKNSMTVLLDRPLKFLVEEGEAYLVVCASIDQISCTVTLELFPQDQAASTLSVLEDLFPQDQAASTLSVLEKMPAGLVIPVPDLKVLPWIVSDCVQNFVRAAK